MLRLRLAFCLLTPLAFAAGCYSERLPPPNFRYACSGDGDCRSEERCISGLCQVPCTQATASEDCPFEAGFAACLNGVCVSPCSLPPCKDGSEDEGCERPETRGTCTAPQMCMDLGFDIGSGGGSFFGSGSDGPVGVCGQECTEGSCPETEICLEGFCIATCDPTGEETCNAAFGLTCQGGLCLPDLGGGDAGDGSGSDASATDTDATGMTSTPGTDTGTGSDSPTDTGASTG